MPLLLMAGILIVLGLTLQIMRLTVFKTTDRLEGENTTQQEIKRDKLKTPVAKAQSDSRNVFEKLHEQYPDHKRNLVVDEIPVKRTVTYLKHNPVWGTFNAPIDVSLFVDHSCKSCREKLAQVLRDLKPYKKDVRVVMKYVSSYNSSDAAGIFWQMAQKEGVFKPYLEKMLKAKDLTEKDFFLLLESAGVPLMRQREMMRDDLKSISKNIQLDIDQYNKLEGDASEAKGFVVYLNGYKLDHAGLYTSQISSYVSKLKRGNSLLD
jgi:hypothetical protein